jgi:tetratricopeptide (TPR) repeat protein
MDVRTPVDEVIVQAKKETRTGNYKGAIALLQPLLRLRQKAKLSQSQENDVVSWLCNCYRSLFDFKAALPHAQRSLVLAQELFGPRSAGYADALKGLCLVHMRLKAFKAARKAVEEALAIMEELGLQQDERYGSTLVALGRMDHEQGRHKEALVVYNKAKVVLVQFKEGHDYWALLSEMAECHEKLHEWNEAVALKKEVVEHVRNLHGTNHPCYATALGNLAVLFYNLKQYEEAIACWEEKLPIYQRVYGDKHESTVNVVKDLASARQLSQQPNRHQIDVGHFFRMCSQCDAVKEDMERCSGCNRVWYCNPDCQLLHWPTHKLQCDVCQNCNKVLTKIKRCARCLHAKYCDDVCQDIQWHQHKKECDALHNAKK